MNSHYDHGSMPGEDVFFAQDRTSQAVARGANLQVALRLHWNNWVYGASTFRFPQKTELLRKLCAIWTHAPMKFRQLCTKPKIFKNIGF
jgi:hypothetical protein